jgi:hypothetical protein
VIFDVHTIPQRRVAGGNMFPQRSHCAAYLLLLAMIPSVAMSQRLTAREAVERAAPAAAQWASDATLIFVGTAVVPGIYADGTAEAWACGYYSAMKDSAYNFYAAAIGPISFEPRPKEGYPSLHPLGASWGDSDAACSVAEARGGRQFRNEHGDAIVAAMISRGAGSQGAAGLWWDFTYYSPADTAIIRFKLDAGTFAPQPQWIIVQRQPVTGADIAFLNSDDDTVAVVHLVSGSLDSIRVAVYAGLSPDTTGTKKAVLRYFDIAAYPENASFTATLTLSYKQEEFRLSQLDNEAGLKLFRHDGSSWQLIGGAADPVRNRVTASNVTKFSSWAIADPNDNPLRVEQNESVIPAGFALAQNYPNPFSSAAKSRSARNPETVIEYQLPRASEVEISIFNLQGQKVATLVEGRREAGSHQTIWNGRDESGRGAATGVYLYRLQAGDVLVTKKMLVGR